MLWICVMWTAALGHCWLARSYELTAEDKKVIVETHNVFRTQVLPSAANMLKMSWDDTLAEVAAGYATKCIWEHNPDLEGMGENLYATTGPFSASKAITAWYLEHLDYHFHNNTCQEDKLCGHYTQVVWADTTLVGCSTHLCEEVMGLTFTHVSLLVCNYAPQGNYEGVPPYEEGEPCSNCPKDLQLCEANICVAEPPSVTEGTTEPPRPGTDGPSHSDPAPTDSPIEEVDDSPTTTAVERATPSEEGQRPGKASPTPFFFGREKEREPSTAEGARLCWSVLLTLASQLLLFTL